jgi:hypothetical protein
MTPRIAIACYKPKAGKSQELKALMRKHHGILKGENLVTDRAPVIMESKDGTIVEVFEWKSKAAIDQAHTNTVVLRMWNEYSATGSPSIMEMVCDTSTLAYLDTGIE